MAEFWLTGEDDVMAGCWLRAFEMYRAGEYKHERIAYQLGQFMHDRVSEQPESPQREALLSVTRSATRTATYASNGERATRQALAMLLRLASAYSDHPRYLADWRPVQRDV